MADKITLLRSDGEPHGARNHEVLYWYTIGPRITDQKGNEIAPQKRADLRPEALPYLTEADLTALDAGDAGFEQLRRVQTASETNANTKTRLLADHAVRESWWVQAQRDRYANAGFSFSA